MSKFVRRVIFLCLINGCCSVILPRLVQRSQKWKDCSEDELKIRRREDQLFEELASNPVLTSDLNPSTRHKL